MARVALVELLNGKTLYRLNKETGIHMTTLQRLRDNQLEAVRFDIIETLCGALNCTTGDLIVLGNGHRNGKVKAKPKAKSSPRGAKAVASASR